MSAASPWPLPAATARSLRTLCCDGGRLPLLLRELGGRAVVAVPGGEESGEGEETGGDGGGSGGG